MSSFTDALIVRKAGRFIWTVEYPFTYHVGEYPSEERITVPKGFQTDFASIPRPIWVLMPPDDDYTQAAVLHDFMCFRRGKIEMLPHEGGPTSRTRTQNYTVRQVTEIFEEAMGVCGVPPWKRAIMFRAVYMFGPKW